MALPLTITHSLRFLALAGVTLTVPLTSWAACNIVNGEAYGNCQNVSVRQGTKPALNVRSSVTESAIVAGAIVHAGGSLHLSGIANGDILVKKGGRLSITGVVNATVRNEGGVVEVEGITEKLISNGGRTVVGGQVGSVSGTGPVIFKKGSILQGNPLKHGFRFPSAPSGSGSGEQ